MLIVFDSMTGNVERFVNKLKNYKAYRINDKLIMNDEYCLITYTIGFGEVPETTKRFLENNYKHLKAVATSGNKVWGDNFGRAGEIISKRYNVPLILKFELSGNEIDIEKFNEEVMRIDTRANA